MSTNIAHQDIGTHIAVRLLEKPTNYECEECRKFCGPHELKADHRAWRESGLCAQCFKNAQNEHQSELRNLLGAGF